MAQNLDQRKQMNALLTKGYLDSAVFIDANNRLIREYESLVAQRDMAMRMDKSGFALEQYIKDMVDFLNKAEPMTEFDDDLFERFVEKITVHSREEITFELKCGLKLKERLG